MAARARPRPPWPGASPQYARCGAPICAGEVRTGLRFQHSESAGSATPAKGKLYVSGWSNSGALGLGEGVTRAEVPTEVPTEGPVVSVAAAKKFTVFATVYMCFALGLLMLEGGTCERMHDYTQDAGKVFAMGDNRYGELGTTAASSMQPTPIQVEGLDGVKIVQVAAGQHHVLALSDQGEVFSWGWGGSSMPGSSVAGGSVGALGHGDTQKQPVPKLVAGIANVSHVACGSKHSIALDGQGDLYSWGLGEQGRLGHGNNTDLLLPTRIENLPPMRLVRCGDHFSGCVDQDGALYMWGKNKVGELGLEGMSVFAQVNRYASQLSFAL